MGKPDLFTNKNRNIIKTTSPKKKIISSYAETSNREAVFLKLQYGNKLFY
jgi:hypothetical protein